MTLRLSLNNDMKFNMLNKETPNSKWLQFEFYLSLNFCSFTHYLYATFHYCIDVLEE